MSKKKIMLGIVVVICAVILAFQVMVEKDDKVGKEVIDKAKGQTSDDVIDTAEEASTLEESTTAKDKDTEKKNSSTKEEDSTKGEEQATKSDNTKAEETKDTDETSTKKESVTFPYNIPVQDITIKSFSGYDGIYVEDGSDDTVKKVATILVKNTSKEAVEYGAITLQAGDKTLEFSFSTLPAGKSCIVMEKNKTTYNKKWKVQSVSADFAYTDEFSKLKSDISMKTVKNNGITITNKTDETIPRVRIFYKYQLDSGEYVGGITYTCKVDDLEAGESRTIYPSHFSSDGSVIMMARRYEEKLD